MKGPSSPREVRLWHWRKVLGFRKVAREFEEDAKSWEAVNPGKKARYFSSKARQNHGKADWHLSAVQSLNEVVSGTAEQDDKEMK